MPDDQGTNPEPTHLYEQLGGRAGLLLIAEKWHERVVADPRLAPLLQGKDSAALRQDLTEFLIQVILGPPPAALAPGSGDADQARRLHERILGHLIAALVWANVPRRFIEHVLDVLAPLGPDSLYLRFAGLEE